MRISWNEYFLACLDTAALRASCDRGKSGAIIVKDNRILATGYVGAPSGIPSCDEVGHDLVKRCEVRADETSNQNKFTIKDFSTHCIRTVHAEQNAIINCARNGVSTLGATIYTTMTPCTTCAMSIIQAGIIRVISKNRYQKDIESKRLFQLSDVELIVINDAQLYSDQEPFGCHVGYNIYGKCPLHTNEPCGNAELNYYGKCVHWKKVEPNNIPYYRSE